MSERALPMKKLVPIIVITWILSLVTTLAVVYFAPSIFPPIKTSNLSDDAVVADKIANGAVITTKLADGTVTSAKILDGTITATDLADGSIVAVKIIDGAVTTAKIADGAISSEKVANGAIVTLKLADGAVTTAKIADNAIVTIKLADGAVTSAKILDGTITAADLATDSVTTIKIADGAVTTTKIADFALTNLKLAPSAIPFASKYSTTYISTTETMNWVDMSDMSVTLTLNRISHLLIVFSTEARDDDPNYRVEVRALVGTDLAYPGMVYLTPTLTVTSLNTHVMGYAAYTFNFYRPSVSAGTYTIKIQWGVSGGTGYAGYRTLTVIALPA